MDNPSQFEVPRGGEFEYRLTLEVGIVWRQCSCRVSLSGELHKQSCAIQVFKNLEPTSRWLQVNQPTERYVIMAIQNDMVL